MGRHRKSVPPPSKGDAKFRRPKRHRLRRDPPLEAFAPRHSHSHPRARLLREPRGQALPLTTASHPCIAHYHAIRTTAHETPLARSRSHFLTSTTPLIRLDPCRAPSRPIAPSRSPSLAAADDSPK